MGRRYRYTIKTLWGIAKSKEIRLTDEELHLLVCRETGKDSIRELNSSELAYVCRILQKQKDDIKRQDGTLKDQRGNPQTVRQRRKVAQLQEQLGWEDRAVRAQAHHMYKVDVVEWLGYSQCQGLIEAMKAILKRREREPREDIKKHPSPLRPGFLRPAYEGTIAEAPRRQPGGQNKGAESAKET